MINKQAIDTMTQMLALISKYSKGAYPEVETAESCENRRRAWAITKMLARLAEHAAESDFYFLLSDIVHKTDAERDRCYQIARQEDDGFMNELENFQTRAKEFASQPVKSNERTDNDIVRELEHLLRDVKMLRKLQADSSLPVSTKLPTKERKLREANLSVIAEQLASLTPKLEAAEKLALTRGMVMSVNRYGTVIKRIEPTTTASPKAPTAATKAKKAPVLKLVTTKIAPQPKTKTSLAKKSA